MTGWRIGWACGNEQLVSGLAKVKSNIDSGIFSAIQLAGITAFENIGKTTSRLCDLYQQRRDVLISGLNSLGFEVSAPKATFYVWIKISSGGKGRGKSSMDFSKFILDKADIIVTPGVGFGKYGEGFIRMALTVDTDRIKEAVIRLKKIV